MKLLNRKIELPMTKSFLSMLVVLILFFIPTILSGQKPAQLIQSLKTDSAKKSLSSPAVQSVIGSIKEYVELHNEFPSEKVFLHLDRFNYAQ